MLNARCIAALLLTLTFASAAFCGESVSVKVKSGRTFTGCVHERSTDDALWLQSCGASTRVLRAIPWSAIESVTGEKAKQTLAASDARKRLSTLISTAGKPKRCLTPADSTYASYAKQALVYLGFTDEID